ncbi:hypothetical protein GCM10025864_38860 [Luteimicrobium album]|uniref:Uncharacterized protein n=1 Tax=Luteimicrobium album TaxID=1054550 RepID=A0ABQ6I653_9MICO|nr:hypothetical protein GCM10025864_38860 [Luteimicrobium album]
MKSFARDGDSPGTRTPSWSGAPGVPVAVGVSSVTATPRTLAAGTHRAVLPPQARATASAPPQRPPSRDH